MSEWTEFKVPVPWGEVAGKEYGDPDGEPWLVLHGWLDNCGSFDRLIPSLSVGKARFICYDSPGHGLSSHYPAGMTYDMAGSLACLRRVAGFFNLKKFSLLGHSLGGYVGFFFASMHPEMVDKLVTLAVIAPTPKSTEGTAKRSREFLDEFLANEALSAAKPPKIHSLESAKKRMLEGLQGMFGKENMNEESMECLVPRGMKEVGPNEYVFTRDMKLYVFGSFHHFNMETLLDFAKNVSCSHLVILCRTKQERKDKIRPVLDQLKENPKFEIVEVDLNHHGHLTDPTVMAENINLFVKNVPSHI